MTETALDARGQAEQAIANFYALRVQNYLLVQENVEAMRSKLEHKVDETIDKIVAIPHLETAKAEEIKQAYKQHMDKLYNPFEMAAAVLKGRTNSIEQTRTSYEEVIESVEGISDLEELAEAAYAPMFTYLEREARVIEYLSRRVVETKGDITEDEIKEAIIQEYPTAEVYREERLKGLEAAAKISEVHGEVMRRTDHFLAGFTEATNMLMKEIGKVSNETFLDLDVEDIYGLSS